MSCLSLLGVYYIDFINKYENFHHPEFKYIQLNSAGPVKTKKFIYLYVLILFFQLLKLLLYVHYIVILTRKSNSILRRILFKHLLRIDP